MIRFPATVAGGELFPLDKHATRGELKHLNGKTVYVEVDTVKKQRSIAQNRRFFGRIVNSLRAIWTAERGQEYTKEQVVDALSRAFLTSQGHALEWVETPLGPVPSRVSTRLLNTAEFSRFCDEIEADYAKKGIVFPDAETAEDANR